MTARGHAVELAVEAQVARGREVRVERRVLEDEADVAAHRRALAHDVEARDARLALARVRERAEDLDRGRLARAVRPQEAERLAGVHGQVEAANRLDVAVALDQPAGFDDRWNIQRCEL